MSMVSDDPAENPTSQSRRTLLARLAAVGAPSVVDTDPSFPAPGASGPPAPFGLTGGGGAIDIHHHLLPPEFIAAQLKRLQEIAPDGSRALAWTPQASIEEMDRHGIA